MPRTARGVDLVPLSLRAYGETEAFRLRHGNNGAFNFA
jgi:hypothetical protein